MGQIVNFPLAHSRNTPLYREPLHQALRHDGMPVRPGDFVKITDTRGHEHKGTVTKVGMPGNAAVTQVYEVRCHDGWPRVVSADQIEALL